MFIVCRNIFSDDGSSPPNDAASQTVQACSPLLLLLWICDSDQDNWNTHTHILYSFLVVVWGLSPTYLKLKFVLETLHTCMQACPRYIAVLNGHGKEFFISMLLHICKIVKSWFIVFMERCTKWNVLFLKFKMVGSV